TEEAAREGLPLAPVTPLDPERRPRPARRGGFDRRRLLLVAAAVVAVAALASAVVASGSDHPSRVTTNTTPPHPTTTDAPRRTAPGPVPGPATPTTADPSKSATRDLEPFFTGAAALDQQLKTVAARINAKLASDTIPFDPSDAAAVAAADPDALEKTI